MLVEIETEIAGMVTIAEMVLVGSATEAAIKVTITLLAGAALGALYVTDTPLGVEAGETVPHAAIGQDTVHVTPLLVESLLTLAVKFALAAACTVAVV